MLNHFSFLQDLDPDAQFISESLSFDVVPGKLGKFSSAPGIKVIDLVPKLTLACLVSALTKHNAAAARDGLQLC